MKLKEAIAVLQGFQSVAGEDAEFEAETLRLESGVQINYDTDLYSYSRGERTEKSRRVTYAVIPVPLAKIVDGPSAPPQEELRGVIREELVRSRKSGCKNFCMRDGMGFCRNCGFHHDEH